MHRIAILAVILMSIFTLNAGSLRLPSIFSPHMVFQREAPISIWGWGLAGSSVRVRLGDQNSEATVDQNGEWRVALEAREAGDAVSLKVESGEERLEVKGIEFGDVWVASGQSNMEWKMMWEVEGWKEEAAAGDVPAIRFFQVERTYSWKREEDVTNLHGWRRASPDTVPEFSAVAWFFAKRNYLEKGVPVGIIECAWGGSPAEAWIPVETVASVPGYEREAERVMSGDRAGEAYVKEVESREAEKWRILTSEDEDAKRVAFEGLPEAGWRRVEFPTDEAFSDVVWLRREFDWDSDHDPARLIIDKPGKVTKAYLNGKYIGEKTWESDSLDLDIEEDILRDGTNVLCLRSYDDWDNVVQALTEGSMRIEVGDQWIGLRGEWQVSNSIEEKVPEVEKLFWTPGFLYNAMIEPLEQYRARGVIWYQGESNTGRAKEYDPLFKSLIRSWRKGRGDAEMPFLFCQLASFLERQENQQQSDWAELREAQAAALDLPQTGMAVLIDIGDALDIHPRNKKDVGERLWLAARRVSFDEEFPYSGPRYRSAILKESKVDVRFETYGSRFEGKIGDEILGFQLAGKDGHFKVAEAKILDGSSILVSAEGVDTPWMVRYAWADNPECDLRNEEGLPGIPFRAVVE
ncbi:MAG: sialate O-acetylesterase [Verrucomicrobiota bacterium]